MTTTNFNKQQLSSVPTASEAEAGLVERATDAEALAGIDTTRYISPASLSNKIGKTFSSFAISNNIEYTANNCPVIVVGMFTPQFANNHTYNTGYIGQSTANIPCFYYDSYNSPAKLSFIVPKGYKFKISATGDGGIIGGWDAYPLLP